MRIAFSGSHRVGKSALVEQVARALPQYSCVDEPYYLLEEDGYESESPPSMEDFEAQLHRSVVEIQRGGRYVLFDRCPADFLAYLLVGGHDIGDEIEHSRDAMRLLDLVVFVPPIEEPAASPWPRTRTASGGVLLTTCSPSSFSMTSSLRTCLPYAAR